MLFQPRSDLAQLLINARHGAVQLGDGQRRADAGHHIFALGVHQVLAIKFLGAGGRIAREAHAGSAGFAQISKDHALHIHCRSQVIGDLVHAPVMAGALVVPGTEDGITRQRQLLHRILRKIALGVLANDFLRRAGDFFQRPPIEIGIVFGAAALLCGLQHLLKFMLGDFQHDAAEHLDEPPIGIPGKAWIVAAARQRFHAFIIEAEIQDGIHHSRHRGRRARAHAHQQRIFSGTEFLPLQLLQPRQRRTHLLIQARRNFAAAAHVLAASGSLNGEARRHRQSGVGHLRQPGALAAQLGLHVFVAIRLARAKEKYVAGTGLGGLLRRFGDLSCHFFSGKLQLYKNCHPDRA